MAGRRRYSRYRGLRQVWPGLDWATGGFGTLRAGQNSYDGVRWNMPGDSGGPTVYNGRLLGVHSFGDSFGTSGGDIDATLNSSFGELAGDARIAAFDSWIAGLTSPVPEPGSLTLLGCGVAAAFAARWQRSQSS